MIEGEINSLLDDLETRFGALKAKLDELRACFVRAELAAHDRGYRAGSSDMRDRIIAAAASAAKEDDALEPIAEALSSPDDLAEAPRVAPSLSDSTPDGGFPVQRRTLAEVDGEPVESMLATAIRVGAIPSEPVEAIDSSPESDMDSAAVKVAESSREDPPEISSATGVSAAAEQEQDPPAETSPDRPMGERPTHEQPVWTQQLKLNLVRMVNDENPTADELLAAFPGRSLSAIMSMCYSLRVPAPTRDNLDRWAALRASKNGAEPPAESGAALIPWTSKEEAALRFVMGTTPLLQEIMAAVHPRRTLKAIQKKCEKMGLPEPTAARVDAWRRTREENPQMDRPEMPIYQGPDIAMPITRNRLAPQPTPRDEELRQIEAAVAAKAAAPCADGKPLVDVDTVMLWARRKGFIVVPTSASFETFRIDGKIKTRTDLLALTNRERERGGHNPWLLADISWTRTLPDAPTAGSYGRGGRKASPSRQNF
jgi:hypothetical protein